MEQINRNKLILKISNLVIIISFILIIVGLFIRKEKDNSDWLLKSKNILLTTPTIMPTAIKKQKINLTGPLLCSYQTDEASISAFIQDQNILGEVKTGDQLINFLVDRDCFYFWQGNKGEKNCGIGFYKNLFSKLENFDLISQLPVNIFSPELNTVLKNFKKKSDHKGFLDFCQKTTRNEEIKFKPPANVLFKNKN